MVFMRGRHQTEAGFSLVELMIVVAIIGVLSALAVPRFQSFQAKAKQSEAKNNLSHIYTLQQSFYGDNDRYGSVAAVGATGECPGANEIGFRISPCANRQKIRYTYASAAAGDGFNASATARANVIVGGCASQDVWAIDHNKNLVATTDAVRACND